MSIATVDCSFVIMAECDCGHKRELHTLFRRRQLGAGETVGSETALPSVRGAYAGSGGLSPAAVSIRECQNRVRARVGLEIGGTSRWRRLSGNADNGRCQPSDSCSGYTTQSMGALSCPLSASYG